MYDPADIALPASFGKGCLPPIREMIAAHEKGQLIRDTTEPFVVNEREAREITALTYGMISMIDDAIGSVVAKIEKNGLAEATRVDLASRTGSHIGPLASQAQFDKVQALIESGISEGARLVAGGLGRPEGVNRGWFARPTVFADVTPGMTIYREEIFGPVLTVTPFDTEVDAVSMANDTPYGLAAYLQTGDPERAHRVTRALRVGMVKINGASRAPGSPFGGYKQSGNGREGGAWGIEEFLEVKSVSGWPI